MKTLSRSLLFLALAATGTAFARDPHAGHHTSAKPSADPHAGHAKPKIKADAPDAHAGHPVPAAKNDPLAGHDMAAMDHSTHGADPHAGHNMGAFDHSAHGPEPHAGHRMPDLPASAAPREPVPVPTAEDFAAAFPTLAPHAMEHASPFNSLVVFDHLEGWDNAHGSGQSWDIDSWFGGDIHRLWLRSEGERSQSRVQDWSADALYGRAISPWWDFVAGVRHDNGRQSPDLTRAAVGFQGMAPYKFEMSAMAYLGGTRKAELAVEIEYDVLLTNRLILQPVIEASLVADDDPQRGVGKGLSSVEAGLRLRYEITRRFAPYVGFVHERVYGNTADLHRDAGAAASESRWVAGVRLWF